jgi:ribosomal protein L37AE/L43A
MMSQVYPYKGYAAILRPVWTCPVCHTQTAYERGYSTCVECRSCNGHFFKSELAKPNYEVDEK